MDHELPFPQRHRQKISDFKGAQNVKLLKVVRAKEVQFVCPLQEVQAAAIYMCSYSSNSSCRDGKTNKLCIREMQGKTHHV